MIKISLVTVTYNAAAVVGPTFDSVFRQTYPAIEHIIVDGASADDTIAVAKDYMERSYASDNGHEVKILAEPDNGIYDAMNKGLRMATGDYVCFLNAGDALHADDTIEELLRDTGVDSFVAADGGEDGLPAVLYGYTDIVDGDRKFVCHRRLSPPDDLSWRSFRHGMLVCHQAFYARTDIAKALPYDLQYRYSADFDWCIRVMKVAEERKLPLAGAAIVVADYLKEGTTTRHHKASLRERFRIMAKYYGTLSTFLMHAWFAVRRVAGTPRLF